jgi:hypothetical protein
VFVSIATVSGERGSACFARGGGPRAGGSLHCGGHPHQGRTCCETFAQEAAAVWDSATLHVKDVEDQADLAEIEA